MSGRAFVALAGAEVALLATATSYRPRVGPRWILFSTLVGHVSAAKRVSCPPGDT